MAQLNITDSQLEQKFAEVSLPQGDTPEIADTITNLRNQIVLQEAATGHTQWQEDRNHEPRVKVLIADEEGNKKWINEGNECPEGFTVQESVDIANTAFSDLPADWKKENLLVNEGVVDVLMDKLESREALNEGTVDDVAAFVHEQWLLRNPWAKAGDLDVPFSELSEEEQEKDRQYVRAAMQDFLENIS